MCHLLPISIRVIDGRPRLNCMRPRLQEHPNPGLTPLPQTHNNTYRGIRQRPHL